MLILHIHIAQPIGIVAFSEKDNLVSSRELKQQEDAQQFIHTAILEMQNEHQFSLSNLDVVSVTLGTGSYTSLRIGLAAAKGICWALEKPLIGLRLSEMLSFQLRMERSLLDKPYAILMNAKRGNIYKEEFDKNHFSISPLSMCKAKEIWNHPSPTIYCLEHEKSELEQLLTGQSLEAMRLDLKSIILLAQEKLAKKDFENIKTVEPLYIQNPYASH